MVNKVDKILFLFILSKEKNPMMTFCIFFSSPRYDTPLRPNVLVVLFLFYAFLSPPYEEKIKKYYI